MNVFCPQRHGVSWSRASITAVFAWLSIISSARSDEALEKAIGAVFRLSNGRSSGTCFLISRGERADTTSVVLVTAAHVLEETSESTCQLMLRTESADRDLLAKRNLHYHPRWQLRHVGNGTPRWILPRYRFSYPRMSP